MNYWEALVATPPLGPPAQSTCVPHNMPAIRPEPPKNITPPVAIGLKPKRPFLSSSFVPGPGVVPGVVPGVAIANAGADSDTSQFTVSPSIPTALTTV